MKSGSQESIEDFSCPLFLASALPNLGPAGRRAAALLPHIQAGQ